MGFIGGLRSDDALRLSLAKPSLHLPRHANERLCDIDSRSLHKAPLMS
jgi:hypothetical protein